MIYGVATLAGCMIGGMLLGEIFGEVIGAGTEVGGVGFAILLLVFITNCKSLPFTQKPGFSQGISFWKAMFIPVVIAMTATQDVFHMLSSGIVAITAGAAAFGLSCLLLYVLRIAEEKKEADQS
jgi:malonate transporter MadL subunit